MIIDAQGVLKVRRVADQGGLRAKRIVQEAMATLNPKLAKPSDLRKISLNRLEKAVANQIEKGEPIPDEMKYLAGLLRIHNVFFYPETGDIVLAGPAEGYAEDTVGRVRGLTTGRPVLELQDVVGALRAYPPGGSKLNVIGVSIDPTEEGLANLQSFIKRPAHGSSCRAIRLDLPLVCGSSWVCRTSRCRGSHRTRTLPRSWSKRITA